MALTKLKSRDVKKVARAVWDYALNHPTARKINGTTSELEATMADLIMHGAKLASTQLSKSNREQIYEYLTNNRVLVPIDFNEEDNRQIIRVSHAFDASNSRHTQRPTHTKPAVTVEHKQAKPAKKEPVRTPSSRFLLDIEDVEILLFLEEFGCIEDQQSVYNVIEPQLPLTRSVPSVFSKLDERGFIERLINGKRTQMVQLSDQGQALIAGDTLIRHVKTDQAILTLLAASGPSWLDVNHEDDITIVPRLARMTGKPQASITTAMRKLIDAKLIKGKYNKEEHRYVKGIQLNTQVPYRRAVVLFTRFLDDDARAASPVVAGHTTRVEPPAKGTVADAIAEVDRVKEAARYSDVEEETGDHPGWNVDVDELHQQINLLAGLAMSKQASKAEDAITEIRGVFRRIREEDLGPFAALIEIEALIK